MKLEIYGEKQEEKVLRLKLIKDYEGVYVAAVGKDGERIWCGNILLINNDGTLTLMGGCRAHGIQTDGGGRIKLAE